MILIYPYDRIHLASDARRRLLSNILVLCLVTAGVSPTLAQGWIWENPLPQGNTLRSISFINQNTGWTVGNAGAILHTTDGTVWLAQRSETTQNLRSVSFIDESSGWTVGNGGTVLHTSDGGTVWSTQTSGTTRDLYSVTFDDASSGWAVGDAGTIIHTTDGGTTWAGQTSGSSQNLYSVVFIDANMGWTVGASGSVLHTSDGGITWIAQTSGITWDLHSITFTDANTGWTVGLSDKILHSTNGGATWTEQTSGSSQNLFAVTFTNANTGWAAGASGTILHTTSGGTTWTVQPSGTTERLEAVSFVSGSTGRAAGTSGIILQTANGGATWVSQTSGTTSALLSIFFADSSTGWTVGLSGTIRHTTDGGITWTVQTGGTTQWLRSAFFADVNTGWLCGDAGTIEHTTNGGTTWTAQISGTGQNLYSAIFTDANTGWTAGDAGTILHTSDGGTTWTAQTSGTTRNLYSLCFIDPRSQWAVGQFGEILHTTDGGTTWTAQPSGTPINLLSVFFTDSSTGWVVGESGTIRYTTDGGANWTPQTSGTTYPLSSVLFTDANTGWATGGLGKIFHTTNRGTAWVEQTSGTTQWLRSTSFTDPNTGWTAGEEGTILHTSTGGTGNIPPPPPTPSSPPDSSLVSTSPLLTWNQSPGALWYSLQVSLTPSFLVKVINQSNVTETSFLLINLVEDSTYYWRVSMTNDSSTSGWSGTRSFRTGRVPAQVFLIEPGNGTVVTSDSVMITWRQSRSEADRYWVERATDSLFVDSVIDSTLTDTTTTARQLQHYETYWWRVRAHNAIGWGEFSEVRNFFAYLNALSPPILLSPPDSATNQPTTLAFGWQMVSPVLSLIDTVRYHLQLSPDAGFDSLIVNDSTLVDTTGGTSSLRENSAYYWRVRAKDSFATSLWSVVWSFMTLPPLPAQVISLSPANGLTVLADSVRFLWARGEAETDRYWFEFGTDSTFATATSDSSLLDTTTVIHNLIHHETYFWRARAHNASGWGPAGFAWSFHVLINAPTAPVLVSPPDDATNQPLTVAFAWRTVSSDLMRQVREEGRGQQKTRAVHSRGFSAGYSSTDLLLTDTLWYHLQVCRDAGFADLIVDDSTLVDTMAGVSSLNVNTVYYWRVRARNLVGAGIWSDTWSFTTLAFPAQVVLAVPEDGAIIGDISAICRWFAGTPVVDRYWFEWAEDPVFPLSSVDSSGTDTISIASPLQNGQTYFWRVRAHNAIGWGEFSAVWSFAVLVTDVGHQEEVPAVFSLSQNYPNPFNPATVITYGLPRPAHVLLEVFNMLGQRVTVLINGEQEAGYHEVAVELNGLASGMYLYRMQAEDFVETRKLLLMK